MLYLPLLKPENYTKLFVIEKGVGFLISDLFLYQYKKLNGMTIYENGTWTAYITNKSYEQSLKNGLALFSSQAKYNQYINVFNEYLLRVKEYLTKRKYTQPPTAVGWMEISNLLKEVWVHYYKTEFFYHDLAHQHSSKNAVLKKQLKNLQHYKTVGRDVMNNLGFNILYTYLDKIADMYYLDRSALRFFSQREVYLLLKYNRRTLPDYKARKNGFVLYSRNNKTIEISGDQAKTVAGRFRMVIQARNEIKGTPACKGRAVGVARVILLNYNNINEQLKEISKMKQGEILVAETTSPEFTPALKKASAVVTNQGGLGSHAAIVSREFNIPCIVGTQIATSVIKTGMRIEIDAYKGIVKIIK